MANMDMPAAFIPKDCHFGIPSKNWMNYKIIVLGLKSGNNRAAVRWNTHEDTCTTMTKYLHYSTPSGGIVNDKQK